MVLRWLERLLPAWLVSASPPIAVLANEPPATRPASPNTAGDTIMAAVVWSWDNGRGNRRSYDASTSAQLEAALAAGEAVVDLTEGFFAGHPGQYRVLMAAGRQLNTTTQ